MGEITKKLGSTDLAAGAGLQVGGSSDLKLPDGAGDAATKGTVYSNDPDFGSGINNNTPTFTPSFSALRLSGNITARNLLTFGSRGMLDLTGNVGYRPGTHASAFDLSLEPAVRVFVAPTSVGPFNAKASVFAGAQSISGQYTKDLATHDFSGWLGQVGASIGGELLLKNKFPIGLRVGVQHNFGGDLGNGVAGLSGASVVGLLDLGALIFDSGKLSWNVADADAGDPTPCEREAAWLEPTPKAVKEALERCAPGTAGCSPEPIVQAAAHNLDSGNPNDLTDHNSRQDALAMALGHSKYVGSSHDDAIRLMGELEKGWDKAAAKDGQNAYQHMITETAPRILPLVRMDPLGVGKKLEGLYTKAISAADKFQPADKINSRLTVLSMFYANVLNREAAPDVKSAYAAKSDALVKETLTLLKSNPEYAYDTLMKLAQANTAVKGRKAKKGKPAVAQNRGSVMLGKQNKVELLAAAKLIKSSGKRSQVIRALTLSMKPLRGRA